MSRIGTRLRKDGYARFVIDDEFVGFPVHKLHAALLEASGDLPLDRHCGEGNRYRRFSQYLLLPWKRWMSPLPMNCDPLDGEYVEFFQEESLNPGDGGIRRRFAPISESLRNDPSVAALILADLSVLSPWWHNVGQPMLVGAHIIKHVATSGRPAASSPDLFHRDGQPFTFVHLIDRQGINGGVNFIAPAFYANRTLEKIPSEDILAQFTLKAPLESYVVKDAQVAHYVDAVIVREGRDKGWRTALLIDFTPYEPRLV
jgi:hypothetical protein